MTPRPHATATESPPRPRRGVTLVEMLVSVALLVLMMTIIVQVFQAATGAVSAAKTYQELDSSLRQLDSTLRTDLAGVTAHLTPPLDPKDNLGYFEIIENSHADNQGEDADDCLRFTTKAPEGQLFTGRFLNFYGGPRPTTVQSQYAEIIYFLRSGNLYRRVLLVAPELQSSVQLNATGYTPPGFPFPVSWQGLNDISAHPSPTGPIPGGSTLPPVLNTLGHLTNRENRYAAPRFFNDFSLPDGTAGQDGIPDDLNHDSIPDFWPTLTRSAIDNVRVAVPTAPPIVNIPYLTGQSKDTLWENALARTPANVANQDYSAAMAFPFIYPYAYSRPDPSGPLGGGWIHTPDPNNGATNVITDDPAQASASLSYANSLNRLNHSPLEVGDSLPAPVANQTWWGFPTWRETLAAAWLDPFSEVSNGRWDNTYYGQMTGLVPFPATLFPPGLTGVPYAAHYLPPMTSQLIGTAPYQRPLRLNPQPFTDGVGTLGANTFATPGGWNQGWEDDLILTGVRSFDVKAYDNSYGGYVDLGWGDDGRLAIPFYSAPAPAIKLQNFVYSGSAVTTPTLWSPPLLNGIGTSQFYWPPLLGAAGPGDTFYDRFNLYTSTYAHEGRIPPLYADQRFDTVSGLLNVGDEGQPGTIRLRRVWDSWSTDYSHAPSSGITPAGFILASDYQSLRPGATPVAGQPWGSPLDYPALPSYPAPYPMPLRGIQIQIRVTDPRGQYPKTLTIRQDFSDKL